ncbi:MAG: hypothetical protein PQJ61_11520 [Spirochaetales bacterium]|uniref:Uncharacterized protein n=1 Tax=Candidatus Thalassospirochaeta sargassi TaxID=3119039 RepID=A0AAJ1IHX0_9SPIO|nr:hypothetical protein [Spirochaetales bacterium]
MKNTLIKRKAPAAALLAILLFASCGSAELTAPTDLTAADGNKDNPMRIELRRLPAEGADIYYVYRSDTENGSYDDAGFSITSSNVETDDGGEELRYLFVDNIDDGEGGTYWYRVTSAANDDIVNESAMSAAASAETYEGTWSDTEELGDAVQLKLAADTSALYAVYVDDLVDSGELKVKKYAEQEDYEGEDETPMDWTALEDSPGTTDESADGAFSVFISGGELYTAFRDASGTDTHFVTMKYFHDSGDEEFSSFAWELVGAEKFNTASTEAVSEISALTIGLVGPIYSAFTEGGAPKLYEYNTTTETWFLRIDATGDSPATGDFPATADSINLLNHNNTLYVGYQKTSPAVGLYLRAYDDSDLQAGGLVTADAVADSNAVFVSGGGDIYAVYMPAGGTEVIVMQFANDTWTAIETAGDLESADNNGFGTLDAIWFDNALYVFYLDSSDSDKGWVKYYDGDEGWQTAQKNQAEAVTTGGTVTKLQLASSLGRLYAGWVEDGTAYVRILE